MPVGFRDVNIWRCWSLMISTFQCWNQNEVSHMKAQSKFLACFFSSAYFGCGPLNGTYTISYHTIHTNLEKHSKAFSWNFSMNTQKLIFEGSCLFPNSFFCRSVFLTFIGYLSNFTWRSLWLFSLLFQGSKNPMIQDLPEALRRCSVPAAAWKVEKGGVGAEFRRIHHVLKKRGSLEIHHAFDKSGVAKTQVHNWQID